MAASAELIRQAQAGDTAAFAELISTYKQRIYGTAYRMTGRHQEVEDIGQEVMLRLVASISQLRNPELFDTWLYRLTQNAVYDYLRKRKRKADVAMSDLSEEQVSFADANEGVRVSAVKNRQAEAHATVQQMLGSIPAEDRVLLERKEIKGLSLRELRELYQVNEGAIKVRLFRARQRARAAAVELAAA